MVLYKDMKRKNKLHTSCKIFYSITKGQYNDRNQFDAIRE